MASASLPQTAQIPVGCLLCEGGNKIQWKCLECSLLMCTRCKDVVHPKFKNTGNHKVVNIKDVTTGESDGNLSFGDYKCKVHAVQICCFYCKDCEHFICVKCITTAHKGHDIVDEDQYKAEIVELLEIEKLLEIQRETERKLSKLTLSKDARENVGTRESSFAEHDTKELQKQYPIVIARHFMTDVEDITSISSCGDGSVWIADLVKGVVKRIKMTEHTIQVLSNIKVDVYDMDFIFANFLLVSVESNRLKLIEGKTGKKSDSIFKVAKLLTCAVHVTRNKTIIIGAVKQKASFSVKGRCVIFIGDLDWNNVSEYEYDYQNKPLFTYPHRITSTSNGNICVIDVLDEYGSGRVVVMRMRPEGNYLQVYTGHPEMNSQVRRFDPKDIITTPSDNIIVADCNNHLLHILNSDGQLLLSYKTTLIGIQLPYSLALSRPGHFFIGCASPKGSQDSVKAKLYELQYSGF